MPGKSITQVYQLSNTGEVDLVMTSDLLAFEPKNEAGEIAILENKEKLNPLNFGFLNADLKLGQNFSLPANSSQEVVLIIKVPENAPEKDYYATLLFQTSPVAILNNQSASQTQTKIGSNLLISVSRTGQPFKKATVEEFRLSHCSRFCLIDSFSSPQFLIRIKNSGHAFFKPLGTISIQGWFNQKETLDLLPQNILSGSIREIQCQKDDQPRTCQSQSQFLLGPLTAKLELGADDFNQEIQQEFRFIALPFKLIISLILIILFLSLIKSKLALDKK